MRFLHGELARFLCAGAVNTFFSLCIYWALLPWVPYAYAYTISFIAGVLSGYALNTFIVFRAPWSWRKLFAFPSVQLTNYLAGLFVTWVAVDILGVPQWLAPVLAVAAVVPLNFLLTRALIKAGSVPPMQ